MVTQTAFNGICFTSFLQQGPSCTKMELNFPLCKGIEEDFGFQITSSGSRIPVIKFFWIPDSVGFLYTRRVWCCKEASCTFHFSLALVLRLRRSRYDVPLFGDNEQISHFGLCLFFCLHSKITFQTMWRVDMECNL